MRIIIFFRLILLLAALVEGTAAASALPITATLQQGQAIGRQTSYLKEGNAELGLDDAVAAYENGRFSESDHPVLSFGIGSNPVWLHFSVENPTPSSLPRRLSIETAWLDKVDIYIRRQGTMVAAYHLGDSKPFDLRPVDSLFFAVNHAFEPGISEVFIRVQTPDPMVVPIYLMTPEQAHARETEQDYSYGFLYGFLLALLAFNATLFTSLRDSRYILYSLYLGMFMLMNISYTGHGFQWFWPDSVIWAQWSNPILMVLYGISGLMFALRFLDMRNQFPWVHKAVTGYCAASSLLLILTVLFDSQKYALLVAFTFVLLFAIIMLALGVISVRAGQKAARYFLLAAVSAMVGASVTALAVWGFIPHNVWTFRAVDIGMLLDATLLALALSYQFRAGQEQRLLAEQLAKQDHLTGMNNRRAFYDKATPIWHMTLRHKRSLAVILLDIDHFKQINDAYGHAHGDEVLIATAKLLMQSIRQEDVTARWGGEEFILLLPEADLQEATALAERLRSAVAGIRIRHHDGDTTFTASFGVAQKEAHHKTLDALISAADKLLYQSKALGRNRVSTHLEKGGA